jgi:ATP-dependent helicase/nuclease subunit B
VIIRSGSAKRRILEAQGFISRTLPSGQGGALTLIGASREAVRRLVIARETPASVFYNTHTLYSFALELAHPELAKRGLVPASPSVLFAVAARIVFRLENEKQLAELSELADKPGLPRAVLRSLTELRMAGVFEGQQLPKALGALLQAYVLELANDAVADRAQVYALATERLAAQGLSSAVLCLDVQANSACERSFLTALRLATAASSFCLVAPSFEALPFSDTNPCEDVDASLNLAQALFTSNATNEVAPSLSILSAPGESRECIEIARAILARAGKGAAFESMAVLLRSPVAYRPHVEEAFRRAEIPAYFSRGAREPHPAGRALLALLRCKQESLSAARFSEYLSLGQVPTVAETLASQQRWVKPEALDDDAQARGDFLSAPETESDDALETAEAAAPERVRAPRGWERLIVAASVVGGLKRWDERLTGHAHSLLLRAKETESETAKEALARDAASIDHLKLFALPILAHLEALPTAATWSVWALQLEVLARQTLRQPESVLGVLAELAPLGEVGPISLREVYAALEPRLSETPASSRMRPQGAVYVGSIDDARGLSFETVFVPGLAEKSFPGRIHEDPLLPDDVRALVSKDLATSSERAQVERCMLQMAASAAEKEFFAVYPRIDLETARPKTPSFYALELVRAKEGVLIGFDELAARAREATHVRLGWPAPKDPKTAIDACEHDLSALERVLYAPESESVGYARYLLLENENLSRALRARARRWSIPKWTASDGLVAVGTLGKEALAPHQIAARSYSATAMQNYASCPYKFYLQAILRLAPRRTPEAIEELDALSKGSMTHETQFKLLVQLRAQKMLPLLPEMLDAAFELLDAAALEIEAHYRSELAPAIERVWQDAMAAIRADLREWLRLMAREQDFVPTYFELAFGLTENKDDRDPRSQDAALVLENGLQLRGSIDLVEVNREGQMRATDHKTGRVRATDGQVIKGGELLQPVFYGLALEVLLKGKVLGGRLAYCTHQGGFQNIDFPLDGIARAAGKLVVTTLNDALKEGMFPAAPAADACKYCDYRAVCGPYEELRAKKKAKGPLKALKVLRDHA